MYILYLYIFIYIYIYTIKHTYVHWCVNITATNPYYHHSSNIDAADDHHSHFRDYNTECILGTTTTTTIVGIAGIIPLW
jgi:hypothetical protein